MKREYDTEMRLCDDTGLIDGKYLDLLNRLRAISGFAPYLGPAIGCTGSAHLAGAHIRCTSPAHEARPDVPASGLFLNGSQIMTVQPNSGGC